MGSVKDSQIRSKPLVAVRVGNLDYSITSDLLKRHFKRYGKIDDAYIVTDDVTKRSRGFGFLR